MSGLDEHMEGLMLSEADEEGEDWDSPANQAEVAARVDAAFSALEAALVCLHPRQDAKETMRVLRSRFVTPAAFFEAPQHVIEASGLNRRDALLFSQIPALTRYVGRERFGPRPSLKRLRLAAAFLKTRYTGLAVEHFYLLCLDASGKLIECQLLQSGNDESAPFYLKDVLQTIVRTRAHAAVISHNHPSFSARPSQADLNCTLTLLRALQPIGTVLLDHVIVCGDDYVSLREHGFVRSHIWIAQNPKDALLRGWLDD